MIKKVIHIADLHIPNDVKNRPFDEMLGQLVFKILTETKDCTSKDEVRIVIVGDLFHQKIRVSNEAQSSFHKLLNFLNDIGKTIIVAGNHDLLENNPDRIDSITPTFEVHGIYKNVTFADRVLNYKSGYIVDDNIVWVLFSIFDKFAKPNMGEIAEKYPDKTVVGLYHGDVAGAVTDVGRMTECGIDTRNFEECDCVMAGHIHKFQELKKHGVRIVYPGSVFQQNMSENITGHGFVVWDIETMKYKHCEVDNKYRILKYEITSYDDVKNDEEILINH